MGNKNTQSNCMEIKYILGEHRECIKNDGKVSESIMFLNVFPTHHSEEPVHKTRHNAK